MQGKASPGDRRDEAGLAVLGVGVWVLLLAMLPAVAVAQVEGRFRIQGTWSSPTDEFREPDEGGDLVTRADGAVGARLGYELLLAGRWGVELAAGTSRHDIGEGRVGHGRQDVATLRVTPMTASVLYHFTPQAKADFYLGGGAAYVRYGDIELTDPDVIGSHSLAVDADLTYVLQAGVDVKLNDRWGLSGGLQWIDTKAKIAGQALPISPVVAGAGVALRF